MATANTIDLGVAKRFKRAFDALVKDGKVKNQSQFAEKLKTVPPNITGIFEVTKPAPKAVAKPAAKTSGKGKAKVRKPLAPRYPTLKMIYHLTQRYGVNAHWLITGKGDMFIN